MGMKTKGWQWSPIGLIICLNLGAAFGLLSCTQSKGEPPVPEKVPAALIGQWRGVDDDRLWNRSKVLVFQPDGNFIAIDDGKDAAMGTYWIKPTTSPMLMDLEMDSPYSSFRGIFRFLDDRTLELQATSEGIPGPVRPSVFNDVPRIYRRVTSEPELPSDVKTVKTRQPPISQRENRGQDYVVAILFTQRQYFDKARQFNPHFFQPSSGFHEEDMDYHYSISPENNVLWVYGQAKRPELRSFTGGLATGQGFASTIRLCRSKQPSQQPPTMYKLSNLEFQCGVDGESR